MSAASRSLRKFESDACDVRLVHTSASAAMVETSTTRPVA